MRVDKTEEDIDKLKRLLELGMIDVDTAKKVLLDDFSDSENIDANVDKRTVGQKVMDKLKSTAKAEQQVFRDELTALYGERPDQMYIDELKKDNHWQAFEELYKSLWEDTEGGDDPK